MARRVNLNRANVELLTTLHGIDRALAERIVAYREDVGEFRTVEELSAVSGISDRMLDRFKDKVTVAESEEEIEERPPMTVEVRLVDGATPEATYAGHTVTATFTRRETLPEAGCVVEELWVIDIASAEVMPEGKATLTLPNSKDLKDDVVFRAYAPDGQLVHEQSKPAAALTSSISLNVAPATRALTITGDEPGLGKPGRLRGRVIDESGRQEVAKTQVVLWGVPKEGESEPASINEDDYVPLAVSETDSGGYFTAEYPMARFWSAHATVAVGDPPQAVPLHLNEDYTFPTRVLLVVDAGEPSEDEDECECAAKADVPRDPADADLARADGTFSTDPGGGRCVDFTKPDRTLEEFSFSYAVRTTEPRIKGMTLEPPPRIPIAHLKPILEAMTPLKIEAAIESAPTPTPMVRAMPMTAAGAPMVAAATPEVEIAAVPTDGIDAQVLKTLARDPDGFSLTKLATAANLTVHGDLLRLLRKYLRVFPDRSRMTCKNAVDWDDEPTIYQACTIAHGHVLHFKQEWVADGYSMGNLLYSLPLAPAQKKQIAIIDWERRERAARAEELEEAEAVEAFISRDRDINEVVTGSLREHLRGGSESSTGSFGAGLGIGAILGPVAGFLGIGGGSSSAESSAWQKSSRDTVATALNQLRDRTIQSASAVRSQRSTVVQSVRQGERVEAQTESVANYNHCHAITIQYFEVLRHLLLRQRLVDVQECLFVPLLMSWFTSDKALRWRDTLRSVVRWRSRWARPRVRGLHRGFDALERIERNYVGSDLPTGMYADEELEHFEGDLRLRFELARPRDLSDGSYDVSTWHWVSILLPWTSPEEFHRRYLEREELKDEVFLERLGQPIAEQFVSKMRFYADLSSGGWVRLPVDATLVSDFVNGRSLHVSLRLNGDLPPMKRKDIENIIISVQADSGDLLREHLPAYSKVIVERGSVRYRTKYSSDWLFRNHRILNDLTGSDDVHIYTPLNRRELRNPREEDKELSRQLLDHLNEHIEYYHHAIWWRMSRDRRYMLLDGFQAPNSGGKSVASVTENRLIGIVGNCLILPVSRGHHLDPTFRQDKDTPIDLLEHYRPTTPMDPTRIALPTRGVYAEAVMGACNSCEFKQEERFWRWDEAPIPDSPASILPLSMETRRAEPPDLTAKDFPPAMVNLQNAPPAPDPTGVAAALQLLGTPNIFRDVAGLEGTQRNALAALQGAMQTAQFFGGKAADLALQGRMTRDVDKAMQVIKKAKNDNMITDDQAKELAHGAISSMIGAGPTKTTKTSLAEQPEVRKLIDKSDDTPGDSSVKLERSGGGESETVDISRSVSSAVSGLFGAGAKPTTISTKSSKADALAHVAKCRASTATSPWKLDRTKVLDRLEQLINDPSLIDQDGLNLCGPAAFVRLWLARDPLAVAKFACELYDSGKSTIVSYKVEPDDDSLIAEDYSAIKAAYSSPATFAPEADWMILGSIRDAENFWFDFEGKPEETAAAGTTPGEVAEFMTAANLYASVKDEGNFFLTKGVDHAKSLKPGPTRDVVLLINAHMLTQMNVTAGVKKSDAFILSAFPNHFIVLTSEIKPTTGDKLTFDYWTWGQHYSGTIDEAVFEANYYGAVVGEGAAP